MNQVKPWNKTSLAPGSGVVTKYLLQRYASLSFDYLITKQLNSTYLSLSLLSA
jgi:hypothetical protein